MTFKSCTFALDETVPSSRALTKCLSPTVQQRIANQEVTHTTIVRTLTKRSQTSCLLSTKIPAILFNENSQHKTTSRGAKTPVLLASIRHPPVAKRRDRNALEDGEEQPKGRRREPCPPPIRNYGSSRESRQFPMSTANESSQREFKATAQSATPITRFVCLIVFAPC